MWTANSELELLVTLRDHTKEQLNHFVCEWYEQVCYQKLVQLELKIKELEEILELKDKFKSLFKAQIDLDKDILNKYEKELTQEEINFALFDELGELNHELKSHWCWWKSTQKDANREKVLEELVDCLHFCLLYDYYFQGNNDDYIDEYADRLARLLVAIDKPTTLKMTSLMSDFGDMLDSVFKCMDFLYLMTDLGFSFDEIYDAYFKKNKVNHERLANGY